MTALSNTTSDLRYLFGTEYMDRNMSWYLNADYGFMNKYFLNIGMSMETSSRFGNEAGGIDLCGVSWGYFPSVSGAWLISSEKFMRNVDFINNLKLRVAYTMTGNGNLPVYANRTYFTSSLVANDAVGVVLSNIGNEKLRWETTGRANVGFDFSILANRLNMNIDYFYSKTKDLVTLRSLNEEAGLQYYYDNNGEMENRGFEIAANARIVDTKDFKFNAGLTVGHYKNKITSLPNGSFTTEVAGGTVLTTQGQPAGVFYGYQTDGVYVTAQEAADAGLAILSSSGQRIPFSAGDMRFVDHSKDGIIGEDDRVVIGDPNPDIYGNFNLNFRWRDLELGALFTYSLGNDAYNAFTCNLESGNSLSNQCIAMENRWMADGQVTDIPRATYDDPMGNARFSDRWIEDASYLKFKRLMLSYRVPVRSTSFLQGVSVWAAVNNLCTLTKYLGTDPEFSYNQSVLYQGVDAGLTPQSRSFQIGVKIEFVMQNKKVNMKTFIKNYMKAVGVVCACMAAFPACTDMMETDSTTVGFEEDNRLDSPNDSLYSVLGILSQVQRLGDRYVLLGELRGDLMEATADAHVDIQEISNFSVSSGNEYASFYDYYNVINNCNYAIAKMDTNIVFYEDKVMIPEYAQIKVIRAWTYWQLGLATGQVSWIEEPVLSLESALKNYPQKNLEDLAQLLIDDLTPYVGARALDYGTIDNF